MPSCCAHRGRSFVSLRSSTMDTTASAADQDCTPTYTTSKQVQAWFLRRSRDRGKAKYADLKVEPRRVRQRVADRDRSRAQGRRQAEDARRQLDALQAENARLRAAVDDAHDALKEK